MSELSRGLRVAGCDLGKATAKFVIATIAAGGELTINSSEVVAHEGDCIGAVRDWYQRAGIGACAALGATGLHADELVARFGRRTGRVLGEYFGFHGPAGIRSHEDLRNSDA